ncbi:MAG: hypothetical protein KA715_04900 [Xanthomonadaceae bacterium]|nr:hypothetical protein [Xanthomonadaceae bacterium]
MRLRLVISLFVGVFSLSQSAYAQFDATAILNALTNQINTPTAQTAIRALITITSLSSDHRAYQPASPLGTSVGIDMGLELTAISIPQNLITDISNAVGSTSLSTLPAVPVPKLHLHKGLGMLDVGVSYLGFLPRPYQVYQIWGGDAKLTIINPDQGLIWALRLNYTYSSFDLIKTSTWTPQVLASIKLDFAEPYAGIGYQIATGTISGTLSQTVLVVTVSAPISASGIASAFQGFGGVGFKLGPSGIKLSLEMAYNTTKMNHLGAKLSLCF